MLQLPPTLTIQVKTGDVATNVSQGFAYMIVYIDLVLVPVFIRLPEMADVKDWKSLIKANRGTLTPRRAQITTMNKKLVLAKLEIDGVWYDVYETASNEDS